MKEGYWINARTGKYWQVDKHCRFVKRPGDADKMGLPTSVREALAGLDCGTGPELDQALLPVMKAGFIRMRGHGEQYTFDYYGDTYTNLWACFQFAKEMAGPYTHIVINNLKTNEQIALSFKDLEERMKSGKAMQVATKLLRRNAAGEMDTEPDADESEERGE